MRAFGLFWCFGCVWIFYGCSGWVIDRALSLGSRYDFVIGVCNQFFLLSFKGFILMFNLIMLW